MKKIYITGTSGTGKSTLSERLQESGIVSFDIEMEPGLCHWINSTTGENKGRFMTGDRQEWIATHHWICDIEKLREKLNTYLQGVVAVGAPSNMHNHLDLFDKVFILQCMDEIILRRLGTRIGNDWGKSAHEQKLVLDERRDFESRLIARGAISLSSEGTVEETMERFLLDL